MSSIGPTLAPAYLSHHAQPRSQPVNDTATIPAGALIAVSCARKLVSAYSGALIRVRRSSDSAEQDIGFVGSVLDASALLAFVGANTGYVVTLYDQSGHAFDLTQSSSALAPIIVNSGSLVTSAASNPSMTVGSNRGLSRADACGLTGAPAITMATRFSTSSANDPAMVRIGATSVSAGGQGIGMFCDRNSGGRVYFALFNNGNDFNVSAVASSHYFVGTLGAGAQCSTATLRQDGAVETVFSVTGSGATVATLVNQNTTLAGAAVSGTSPAGEVNCFMVWNAVLAGVDLTTLESILALHV